MSGRDLTKYSVAEWTCIDTLAALQVEEWTAARQGAGAEWIEAWTDVRRRAEAAQAVLREGVGVEWCEEMMRDVRAEARARWAAAH